MKFLVRKLERVFLSPAIIIIIVIHYVYSVSRWKDGGNGVALFNRFNRTTVGYRSEERIDLIRERVRRLQRPRQNQFHFSISAVAVEGKATSREQGETYHFASYVYTRR